MTLAYALLMDFELLYAFIAYMVQKLLFSFLGCMVW
jgi:hypothetical protein